MKKFLLILLLLCVCSCGCYAIVTKVNDNQRQGCCSHHGGVCGCSHGRALCCDRTLSPSCGCN